MTVEFRKQGGSPRISLEQVIPETGADASALPWADCEQLALDPGEGAPGLMGGRRRNCHADRCLTSLGSS